MNIDKIASVDPLMWSPFEGISLLLDNPGESTGQQDGLSLVRCDRANAHGHLKLYDGLADLTDRLADQLAIFGFCRLPRESYHVTVWDGFNKSNLGNLTDSVRDECHRFLRGLPASAVSHLPSFFPPLTMSLDTPGQITLRVHDLHVFQTGGALVARLEPADQESARVSDLISRRRAQLDERYAAAGKPPNPPWTPHVSVGYFATTEGAAAARSQLPQWDATARQCLNATIQFSSISLYAFTDMAHFWLCQSPALRIQKNVVKQTFATGNSGDRKIARTYHWPTVERLGSDEWSPRTASGKPHFLFTPNLDVAVFSHQAKQDRHHHEEATEVYTVLEGTMRIVVAGTDFILTPSDTIVVFPGAVHEVKPDHEFLAQVVTANCRAFVDKLKDEVSSALTCTPREALIVRSEILRRKAGRLGEVGAQKIMVVSPARENEIEPPPDVLWSSRTDSGQFPIKLTSNVELAVFDETAKQDRHIHKLATEVYTVIDGDMTIEIEGKAFELSPGDTVIVKPWAPHEVRKKGRFLAQVLSANSGGELDKFRVDSLPSI